jgi:hypothetical protein
MTLDERGKRAADGLKESVSGHPLLMMSAAPAKLPLLPRVVSFAGAFAVVLIFGLMLMQTSMFASDDDETAETTPATVPSTTTTIPETTVTTTVALPSVTVPSEGGGERTPIPADETPIIEPPDTTPPDLVITAPADGDRLKETAVAFVGMTEPGATVMAGPYEATVKEDGTWSIVLILSEGGNKASFTATDEAGNSSEASIVVYYDPPTTTTTKPVAEWEYTAYATYGSCELNPPYDEYYGTAAPGTKILVTSEYGSGSTVTNAEGEWWVKVEFPTAPYGVGFLVKVKNETTLEKFTFEFVSWAPE